MLMYRTKYVWFMAHARALSVLVGLPTAARRYGNTDRCEEIWWFRKAVRGKNTQVKGSGHK